MSPGLPTESPSKDHGLDWWCDGWWRDPKYLLPYPSEEVERCVEIIKPVFTSQWLHEALTADRNHTIGNRLVDGQGFRMAQFIVGTGHIFESLANTEGFSRKVDELKGPKHAATYFEMSLASTLVRSGATVRFPKEGSTKVPDLLCEAINGPFAVECKRLGEERWETWERALFDRLMRSSATRGTGDEVAQIELNQRLSELRLDDEYAEVNEQLLVEFEREIEFGLLQKPTSDDGWVSLGGLGRVRMASKAKGEFGSVSGFAISPTAKLRRILRNGVLEAAEQLPLDLPGLIAVFSFYQPDLKLADIAFRAVCKSRPELMSHVVALVVFPGGTIFQHDGPMLFLNEHSRFKADSSDPVCSIRSAYKLS